MIGITPTNAYYRKIEDDDQLVPVKGPRPGEQLIYVQVMPEASWRFWPFHSQGKAWGPALHLLNALVAANRS